MDKRVLSGLAALTLLDISAAQAQNWTGPYVGIHGGYRFGDADLSAPALLLPDPVGPNVLVPARSESFSLNSGIIGGHVGYNLQTFGNVLLSIEGDLTYGGGDDSRTADFITSDGVITRISRAEMNWQGTIRARLGLISGRTVFYVTAGGAFADVEWSESISRPAPFVLGPFTVARSDTLSGLVAGGGVEMRLNGNSNILVRGEYLYEDFGSMRVPLAGAADEHGTLDTTAHKVRIGVSLLLNTYPEPLK